jgi:hypothetical protein
MYAELYFLRSCAVYHVDIGIVIEGDGAEPPAPGATIAERSKQG